MVAFSLFPDMGLPNDNHNGFHYLVSSLSTRERRDMKESKVITAKETTGFDFGGLAVQWKIEGGDTGNRFAVVHHPMQPHALAAPLHYHHNEDEISYVLQGRLGALLGDDVIFAEAGAWVFKPRRQWHTFWNAGETTSEIIEIISPAGFENYFREVAASWGNVQKFAEINRKYSLDMDFESIPSLCDRFGLTFPQL